MIPGSARRPVALLAACAAACLVPAAHAQGGASAATTNVFRCPGPPVLYTDALTPQEARDRGCRTIEGAPITIIQAPRPRAAPAAGASSTTTPTPVAARPSDSRVDPGAQRARDNDARRILTEELRKEEERLAALLKEYNQGEPERRGDERNYQRYIERVAELKAGIARKEADIAALRREIGKLAP